MKNIPSVPVNRSMEFCQTLWPFASLISTTDSSSTRAFEQKIVSDCDVNVYDVTRPDVDYWVVSRANWVIGACNGLLPVWYQAVIWTNADVFMDDQPVNGMTFLTGATPHIVRRLKSPATQVFVQQLVRVTKNYEGSTKLVFYEGNSSVKGGFPSQKASSAESIFMSVYHHDSMNVFNNMPGYLHCYRYIICGFVCY